MTTTLKFLLGFVGSFLILWGAGDWLYDAWTRWRARRTRAAIARWREKLPVARRYSRHTVWLPEDKAVDILMGDDTDTSDCAEGL
jgi:hypothetical protein